MASNGLFRLALFMISLHTATLLQAECQPQSTSNMGKILESKEIVAEIQRNLDSLGHFSGSPNGLPDEALTTAIRKFQKNQHLPVDGTITEPLRMLLLGTDSLPADSLVAEAATGRLMGTTREISADPRLDTRDEQGWTPLLYAVLHGQKRTARTLLKAGAQVDLPSRFGTTPLMVAVIMNRTYILRQLLKEWPDLDLPDHRDESAEVIAFNLGRHHMLRLFRKQREAMQWSRLGRIPPFKVRMITWDPQECYRATTARIDVSCQVEDSCRLKTNTLKLCHERGKRYMGRLVRIVQRKWGGRPEVLEQTQPDSTSPFDCREGDVVVFGVRSH
jgi:uncharacterized protein